MNNPTLSLNCGRMIGRADIEGSKSHVAMNAWRPQASYPCGNFSDTSDISAPCPVLKGKVKPAFALLLYVRFPFSLSWPFLRYISVASLLSRGHVDGDACGTQLFFFSNSKFYFSEIILGFRCRGADHQSVLVPQVSIGPDGLYNFIIFGAV